MQSEGNVVIVKDQDEEELTKLLKYKTLSDLMIFHSDSSAFESDEQQHVSSKFPVLDTSFSKHELKLVKGILPKKKLPPVPPVKVNPLRDLRINSGRGKQADC